MSVERQHATLQTEPKWEAGENLEQNASQRPYVENEGDLGEILHSHVGLLGEAFGEERVDLRRQVLRSRLDKLALVLNGTTFFVEEERGAQVDDFQGAY